MHVFVGCDVIGVLSLQCAHVYERMNLVRTHVFSKPAQHQSIQPLSTKVSRTYAFNE